VAHDHDILYTQVPERSIIAHKSSGAFGGCSAWTGQPGGFRLPFFSTGTKWQFAPTFNPADRIDGAIDTDGQCWTTTLYSTGETLVSPLIGPIIDADDVGHLMRPHVGGNVLNFSMAGSRNAINTVFDCLRQPGSARTAPPKWG